MFPSSAGSKPLLLAGVALFLALTSVLAQDPPGIQGDPSMGFPSMEMMGGAPSGKSLMLASKVVQDDLALTDKQKNQFKKLDTSLKQKMHETMMAAREEDAAPEEVMRAMNTLRREHEVAINRELDKNQKARLTEIDLQRDGLLALTRSEVATKLKLTSAQTKKIKAIASEMRQAMSRAMPAPPENGQRPMTNSDEFKAQVAKIKESSKKIRASASEKIGEVLTSDQKEAFDKLMGKPFDLTKLESALTIDPANGPLDGDPSKEESLTKSKPAGKTRKNKSR